MHFLILIMTKEVSKVLKEQLELIRPSDKDVKKINEISLKFVSEIKKNLKNKKIKADVFIGGSLAKGTLVKKDVYDADIFVRFIDRNDSEILDLLKKILNKKFKKVHGSRDYYQIKEQDILVEIIPVLKIKKPEDASNVTDLSYFHVNYIVDRIKKNLQVADEIRLAKAFAHAQDCYGAESYIHGFSGYALELLICHYKSFLRFIKEFSEWDLKKGKIIIDDSKLYKNKDELVIELNQSKRTGPLILIDPTFKERNTGSSLNEETFYKFQKACKDFLKKPSLEFFKKKNIADEFKKFKDVKIISVKTSKQAGDIAGTKSKKFFYFMLHNLKKEFLIEKENFDYDEEKNEASFYFAVGKKKDEIVKGPPIPAVHDLTRFKKAHPNAFIKNGYAYALIKHSVSFEEWFKKFLKHDKEIIKGMDVVRVEMV